MRVLIALHKPMARTVRIALWGGEEQGVFGSKAYVQKHFAARDSMKKTAEYDKFDIYINNDGGSGRFRAAKAAGDDATAAIFRSWIAPLRDLGLQAIIDAALAPSEPLGSDYPPFLWIGLPGIDFMQDPLEYETRSHHSNMDVYDRVQAGDLMQCTAVEAWFAYNAATRPEMLPRLETPMPLVAN
jgi:carboxypeptidase Q